ncbi:hypothetical protein ACFLYL_01615 [Chloroflexota bacterium]
MSTTAGSSATSVALPSGQRAWWYSDEAAQSDITFGTGTWTSSIFVFCQGGDEESDKNLTVSLWSVAADGAVTTPFATEFKTINTTTTHTYRTFSALTPGGSVTIPLGYRIGYSVEWAGSNNISIGFDNEAGLTDSSWLQSDISAPLFPVPELAIYILLSLGLVAIILFYTVIKRRKRKVVSIQPV